MVNMTLAVPKDLKQEMDEFPVINWSQVAREAFADKLAELKLLKNILQKSKLTQEDALELADKIKEGIFKKHKAQ